MHVKATVGFSFLHRSKRCSSHKCSGAVTNSSFFLKQRCCYKMRKCAVRFSLIPVLLQTLKQPHTELFLFCDMAFSALILRISIPLSLKECLGNQNLKYKRIRAGSCVSTTLIIIYCSEGSPHKIECVYCLGFECISVKLLFQTLLIHSFPHLNACDHTLVSYQYV